MILPRFRTYHENLNLYYLNLESYMEFLKIELFNGYIQIISENNKYFIFLTMGEVLNCFQISNNKANPIQIYSIFKNINNNNFLNTYSLTDEQLNFFVKVFFSEALYENLTTEFINVNNLLDKLKKENHTGWLKTDIKKKIKGSSYVYFNKGRIIGTSTSWNKWKFNDTEKALNEIINNIENGVFYVYKIKNLKTSHNDEELFKNIINFFEEYMSSLEENIGTNKFSVLWREKALKKADKYKFLDPFADEFEYSSGKIRVWNGVEINELTGGLKELCLDINKDYDFSKTKNDKIKKIASKYQHIIDKMNLKELVTY
ncbi:hypothetical protein KFV02_07335 [Desulfohalobiaceae bacterium Ax17]|uniref:hypothetical protein n=1 Tax=Desulfovulcanus ferrireducens TaxID=2831190 RepID=UPI00207BC307|nr:hypothetical protein [Desulfovulcanus ferrireducens]MBT8763743.1 hypothetical protein [Desulfovulcanus ferrireducens]